MKDKIEQAIDKIVEQATRQLTTTWGFMDEDYSEFEEMADYRMGEDITAQKQKVEKLVNYVLSLT